MTESLSLTLIVLTFNEEMHIARCLESAEMLAERIVVVDSFSTDRTVEIARSLGADAYQRSFKNQADQFQWAIENCDVKSEWILRLDADEYLESRLAEELLTTLPTLPTDVTGVEMKRKVIFRDTWIRHGGYYPTVFLRAWRKGAGRVEQRWMDEHVVLSHGNTFVAKADFVDHNLRDITWWTDKHNRFTTRQMVDFINLEFGLFPVDHTMEKGDSRQARTKRFLRNKVFGRTPLYVRGVIYFLLRYVVQLGFLDGRQGFVFHFLQGGWNWILIDAKIDEARGYIRLHGLTAFREHLRVDQNIEL